MTELISYLENKNIALVGNAKSIFSETRNIEQHEIIIRMNKGNPKGKESFIGKRTDILALSLNLKKEEIEAFNSKFIFYCSPKNREFLSDHLKESAYYYPNLNWSVLHKTLEARPSTGCMMFDFLFNYVDFAELHLYGFDFMRTPNWYTDKIHMAEHNYINEEAYIKFNSTNDKRIVIHE